jgi:hypothetical protein
MKKILLVLFILLSAFLFFSLPKAQAQTPTPADQILQVPGYNCGNAESTDPNVQKCCLSSNLSFKDRKNIPDVWCVSDIISSPVKAGCPGNIVNGIVDYVLSAWPIKNIEEYFTGVAKKINPCINGNPSTLDYSDPSCVCKIQPATTKILCDKYLANSKDYGSCVSCAEKGVWTSIGCINNDLNTFIGKTVFGFGIGLAGGFSLLCIIYAAFMMQSSQGNPEKLKKAQEMITSCIMGLMLIIFSVFILRLIGVNILKIPGFG